MNDIDLAFIPIGDNFTMGIDDAVQAADFVECGRIMGVHYNTFGYIVIDTAEATRKFEEAGKELLLPGIGESLEV